jgi:GNAT superfamily N-acetyltransferase
MNSTLKQQTPIFKATYYINDLLITSIFFGPKGWDKEPLTKALNCSDLPAKMFAQGDWKMSITAGFDGQPIGYVSSNQYMSFYNQAKEQIALLRTQDLPAGHMSFINVIDWAITEGKKQYDLLIESGLTDDEIVHSCGLCVLTDFEGHGIASELYKRRVDLLKNQGKKAIIVETTNIKSFRALAKDPRYRIIAQYNYQTPPAEKPIIPLDDNYTVWCGLLN